MSLKTKLGMALATTALGAALVAGGTFALFTGSAANSGNTFTAGTVHITDTTGHAAFSTSQFVSNLAPGDSENGTVTVKNDGTLDAWVAVQSISKDGGLIFTGSHPLSVTAVNTEASPVLVAAGQSVNLSVHYELPLAADNSYQQATGTATFNIEAVQARNNTNGNNNGPNSWNQ